MTTDGNGAIDALVAAYGAASDAGFGSAVFQVPLAADGDLADAALTAYRAFVGPDRWQRLGGDAAWLGPWALLWERPAGAAGDIVAELRGLSDRGARMSAGLLLDEVEGAEDARAALATVFDDPAVTRLAVYRTGDGAAMSGLAIAGHTRDAGVATVVLLLMD